MVKVRSIEAMLIRPDQERVRADLAAFFGPRPAPYLRTYEKMLASGHSDLRERRHRMVWGWSWPAFLGGFAWFFYRKMYLYGAVLVLVPAVASCLFDDGGISDGIDLALAVLAAILARSCYVAEGLHQIAKADELGLAGHERARYVRRVGGVSPIAGLLAGIVYVSINVVIPLSFVVQSWH